MAKAPALGQAVSQKPVISPNLGLYLGGSSFSIPPRALEACNNVRLRFGSITSEQMGWAQFAAQALNGIVTLVTDFTKTDGTIITVVGTTTDLAYYDEANQMFKYITPRYATGTVSNSAGSGNITGVGTLFVANVKIGDYLSFGSAADQNPASTWFRVTNVTDNTHLVVAGAPVVHAGVAYTVRKTFLGVDSGDFWDTQNMYRADVNGDGTLFENTILFANNYRDYLMSWNGTATVVTSHAALGIKPGQLALFKGMLIYVGFVEDGGEVKKGSIKNSDIARPYKLLAGTDGLAGEFVVTPQANTLLAAELLGDDLMFYTTNDVVDCAFIGSPDIFAFRTAVPQRGLRAPRLIAVFPDFHQFLSYSGLYWFNGAQATQTDTQVWRDISARFDDSRANRSFCIIDDAFNEVLWAVTLVGETSDAPTLAYTAHILEDPGTTSQRYITEVHNFPYAQRDFPFTGAGKARLNTSLTWNLIVGNWNVQTGTWLSKQTRAGFYSLFGGTADGKLMTLNSADDQNGTGYRSFATFGRRPITGTRVRSLLRRLYPYTQTQDGTYPLTVQTSYYNNPNGPVIAGETTQFDLTNTGQQFINPYRRAMFFNVTFSTGGAPTTGQPWTLDGYDIDAVVGSERLT